MCVWCVLFKGEGFGTDCDPGTHYNHKSSWEPATPSYIHSQRTCKLVITPVEAFMEAGVQIKIKLNVKANISFHTLIQNKPPSCYGKIINNMNQSYCYRPGVYHVPITVRAQFFLLHTHFSFIKKWHIILFYEFKATFNVDKYPRNKFISVLSSLERNSPHLHSTSHHFKINIIIIKSERTGWIKCIDSIENWNILSNIILKYMLLKWTIY